MELKNLESFIQVAELGSFTKAAKRLGYTQSTVSFQIRQLEEELGVPLFERIHHTVRLTAKGRSVQRLAHEMLQAAEGMKRTAGESRSLKGTIRIAMAASLCTQLFRHDFTSFRQQHPDISLTVTTGKTEEMFRLLNQNEVDLVYTLDNHIYDRNYVTVSEEEVSVHFVASAENPLAARSRVSPEELISCPAILTEKNVSYRKLLDEYLASHSLELLPYLEIGDTSLICSMVEAGMGISFLPDFVTEASVREGRMIRFSVPEISVCIWKQLLYHREKWVSPEMEAVMEYLQKLEKDKKKTTYIHN